MVLCLVDNGAVLGRQWCCAW